MYMESPTLKNVNDCLRIEIPERFQHRAHPWDASENLPLGLSQ
jgi:hypothetical protein